MLGDGPWAVSRGAVPFSVHPRDERSPVRTMYGLWSRTGRVPQPHVAHRAECASGLSNARRRPLHGGWMRDAGVALDVGARVRRLRPARVVVRVRKWWRRRWINVQRHERCECGRDVQLRHRPTDASRRVSALPLRERRARGRLLFHRCRVRRLLGARSSRALSKVPTRVHVRRVRRTALRMQYCTVVSSLFNGRL